MSSRRVRRQRWGTLALVAALAVGVPATIGAPPAGAAVGHLTTFAGSLGHGPATRVAQQPAGIAVRGRTLYVSTNSLDSSHGAVIRAVDLDTGQERVVFGTGDIGPTGDGGPAIDASFRGVKDLAFDAAGNLFVLTDDRVRRIDLSGRITTVAGGGMRAPEDIPATEADLRNTIAMAVDGGGNLYLSHYLFKVYRVEAATGIISRFAGAGGSAAYAGDGGPALEARLIGAGDIAVDRDGNVFLVDGSKVRRIDRNGIIDRFAGGGTYPSGANGVLATEAEVYAYALAFDNAGNLLISETSLVRRVDAGGRISTIAGNGREVYGVAGMPVDPRDGEPATGVPLQATDLAVDAAGNLYVAEGGRGRVRRVAPSGIITTIAGNGTYALGGDGGPARQAQLFNPGAVAFDRHGNAYIADNQNGRIRKVTPAGTISSLRYPFWRPTFVAVDGADRIFVAASGVLWRMDPDGLVTRLGGDQYRDPDDGVPLREARLSMGHLAVDRTGNVYVADGHRVHRIGADGILRTVAGGGSAVPADGTAATAASLAPVAVALDAAGTVHLVDLKAQRVWKVGTDGRLKAVAGSTRGFGGDGGPATQAQLSLGSPGWTSHGSVAVDGAGQVFVWDFDNRRIRRVDTSGTITTVAGTGQTVGPFEWTPRTGDSVPATSTPVLVNHMALDRAGNLYYADSYFSRVRKVEGVGLPAPAATTEPVARPVSATSTWGYDAFGQLGDGATATRPAPAAVPALSDVATVAGGGFHSLALREDGTVWAWGLGHVGQLGSGARPLTAPPARVKALTDVVAVAAGTYHSLAVRGDGTVWAWGWNAFHQLGTGTRADSAVPVQVPGLSDVVAVAAGVTHSLALRRDGTVRAWGLNHVGQLGTGGRAASSRPVVVPGLAGVASVAAGSYHSAAVKSDGSAVAWGWNVFGQVGDGTRTDRLAPVSVRGLPAARSLAAGAGHTVGLARDGSVWTWGLGNFGQLGRPGGPVSLDAGRVDGVAGVVSVTAGGYHGAGVRADGSVAAWGWNAFGQVGDGTTVDRPAPVAATRLAGVRSVGAGLVHGLAAAS